MNLPSAAEQLIEELKTLNAQIEIIAATIAGVEKPGSQSLDQRIDQLELKIRDNAIQDYIRQEIQNHNDQVLAQRIDQAFKDSPRTIDLEKRIRACENQISQYQGQAVSTPGSEAVEAVPSESVDKKSEPAVKRASRGKTSS